MNNGHRLMSYSYRPIAMRRSCQAELHRGKGVAAEWVELIMTTDYACDVWFTCTDCHLSGLHRARYFDKKTGSQR